MERSRPPTSFCPVRRSWVLPLVAVNILALGAAHLHAQDSLLLRKVVERAIVAEMKDHHSEQTAWYNEKSKDKQKIWQMNLFGREIDKRVASWTEQSQTWVWVEEPDKSLSVAVRQLAARGDRLEFAIDVRSKLGFRVWGRIPKLVRGNASGTLHATFSLEGSAAAGGGGLKDSRVTKLQGKLSDLQFNNDLASPLEKLVTDALNDHVRDKNEKLRTSIERAINRAKL
ncbi:MAG: hypothetical protein AB7O59_02400 [Pirellulales bacterium]